MTTDLSRLDVTASAVAAHAHLIDLQAHPVREEATLSEAHDWYAAAFRDLAAMHPEVCATESDYPGWIPPHITPEVA